MEIDGLLECLDLICFSATAMCEDCSADGRCVDSKVSTSHHGFLDYIMVRSSGGGVVIP